jgi:SagB-type dehydrogenase family enzyme
MNTQLTERPEDLLAALQEDLSVNESSILTELLQYAKYNAAGDRVEFDRVSIVSSFLKTYTDVMEDVLAANEGSMRAALVPKMMKEYPGQPFFSLPSERAPFTASFQEVMQKRESFRDFVRKPMSLIELATVLETAYGVKGRSNAYGVPNFPMRAAPNAGGLQSIEVYAVTFDVEGLEPGIYYYNADRSGLIQIDRGLMRRRVHQICLFLQEWISEAGAVLFLTCNLDKLFWKYGKKAYRMTHMDAGVVADHLHLTASAIGLGSCLVSGMFDQEAARLLGVDGRREFPTLAVCLGKSGRD